MDLFSILRLVVSKKMFRNTEIVQYWKSIFLILYFTTSIPVIISGSSHSNHPVKEMTPPPTTSNHVTKGRKSKTHGWIASFLQAAAGQRVYRASKTKRKNP